MKQIKKYFKDNYYNKQLCKLDNSNIIHCYDSLCNNITQENNVYYEVTIQDGVDIIDITNYGEDFMNEWDEYSYQIVSDHFDIIKTVSIWDNEDLCAYLLQINPHLIDFVINKTPKLIVLAHCYKKTSNGISDFPKDMLTVDVCKEFINQTSSSDIFDVIRIDTFSKEEYYELCKYTIQKSYDGFSKIPQHICEKYNDLYFFAITKNYSDLKNIPIEFHTDELYLHAIMINPLSLQYIPDERKTYELCLTAVKNNKFCNNCHCIINCVPQHLITEELCCFLLSCNDNCYCIGSNIKYIPKSFLTEKRCIESVKKCGCNLKYIDADHQTEKICWTALKESKCENTLCFVINKTSEMIKYCEEKYGIVNLELKKPKQYSNEQKALLLICEQNTLFNPYIMCECGLNSTLKLNFFSVKYRKYTNFSVDTIKH